MSELDLIPADYAREQLLLRRLRLTMLVLIAIACLVLLARSGLGVLLAAEKQQVSRLQAKKLLWQQSKAKTDEYTNQALAMEKQLVALDELRGRDHLRLFLEALDNAYMEKVWFDELKYYRRENLPRPKDDAAAPVRQTVAPRPPGVEQRVGVTGHALNHVTLAEFMKKLERQSGVGEVSLLDTSPRTYPNALIIDFKLGLLIEPKPRGRP